jgi:hypothetical protein
MRGIAGILRRDGGPVPQEWGKKLEQSLMFGGSLPFRFEDSIPIESGDLHILLLWVSDSIVSGAKAVDGDLDGECAYALWKEETLELELGRRGTGQNSLYWLDLDAVGDGLLFSTNPLPLLKIARELELPNDTLLQGVQEYLQNGFVIEGGGLLAPLYSMPLQHNTVRTPRTTTSLQCDFSATPAQDVQTLVQILGTPFANPDLLSSLQQYRFAKELGCPVVDGLGKPQSTRILKRLLREKQEEKNLEIQRHTARRIELGAIAGYVGVSLTISKQSEQIEPIPFPLATWLQSSQSQLGQLAGDTLHIPHVFGKLPIDQNVCIEKLDAHKRGEKDNSLELFALLTLALWLGQVDA